MSERTLKQLVGALALVVAVGLVVYAFSGGSGSIGASGAIAGVFEGVTPAGVETIEITRSGATVTLARSGEEWTANGYPADTAVVARLLDGLAASTIGDLAATNPANHARMGVVPDSAIDLTFRAAGRDRTLMVGKSGRRFGTAYVRLPTEDDVYLLESDLRGQLARDLDGWRNRTMVTVDTAAVERLEVVRAGTSYSLERGDSVWTFAGGGETRASAVNGMLAELSRLVASGFVAEGDSIAQLPLATTTRAYDASGAVLAEITIGAGDGDRWARNGQDDYIYRVSSFRAGRVAPTREDAAPPT